MLDGFVKSLNLLGWLGFKGKPVAARKPAGYTKTTGPHGEYVDCDTLQCVHCQGHWEVVVGSGKQRGYCRKCMGPTCGSPDCMACVHWEQRLENTEAGRPLLWTPPTQVVVPGPEPTGSKKLIVAG